MHNVGYFLWSTSFFTIFGYVVVEFHLSCIMKQTSFHNCILFHCFFLELNVYIHEDVPGVTFVIGGVTSCQWCYRM
jgi:hypothetical protein